MNCQVLVTFAMPWMMIKDRDKWIWWFQNYLNSLSDRLGQIFTLNLQVYAFLHFKICASYSAKLQITWVCFAFSGRPWTWSCRGTQRQWWALFPIFGIKQQQEKNKTFKANHEHHHHTAWNCRLKMLQNSNTPLPSSRI